MTLPLNVTNKILTIIISDSQKQSNCLLWFFYRKARKAQMLSLWDTRASPALAASEGGACCLFGLPFLAIRFGAQREQEREPPRLPNAAAYPLQMAGCGEEVAA